MAGEKILICDDGRENRDFIIDYIITPNEFVALTARNGVEAMNILSSEPVDLMLLDLQMPKMGGMEVLDAMREQQINVPVVLMTFHGSEEIAIEVYRKGVKDYVKKPFSVEEMTSAIGRALSEVRLRQEKEKLTERLIQANAEMNRRIRELNMLYQVGKTVTALSSLDDLLPHVLRAAIDITDCDSGYLFLVENNQLVARAIKSADDSQIRSVNQPYDDPFAKRVMSTGKPFVLNQQDIEDLKRENPKVQFPNSVMVTPMIVGQRIVGVLMGQHMADSGRDFRKQDAAMLSALSDYAAIAIENAHNHAELVRFRESGNA